MSKLLASGTATARSLPGASSSSAVIRVPERTTAPSAAIVTVKTFQSGPNVEKSLCPTFAEVPGVARSGPNADEIRKLRELHARDAELAPAGGLAVAAPPRRIELHLEVVLRAGDIARMQAQKAGYVVAFFRAPQIADLARQLRGPRDALAATGASVEALGETRASAPLLQCLHALAVRTEVLLNESKSLSAEVRDIRLGLEISVIQAFADKIVRLLQRRDPLSENVHLGSLELLAYSIGGAASEMTRRATGRRPVSKPAAGA